MSHPSPARSRAVPTLVRALRRRSPNCGGRGVFRSYLQHRPGCPTCALRLDRGEKDFFIGAYTINLIVAELIVFFGGIATLLATWPDVPWTRLTWTLAALMVIAPILLYPYARQLWLATDLIFRPAEGADFADVAPMEASTEASSDSTRRQAG